MRFYTTQHQFYCGIDLHAKKMYLCVLDSLVYFVKWKSPEKSCKFPHQPVGIFTWPFWRMSACFIR